MNYKAFINSSLVFKIFFVIALFLLIFISSVNYKHAKNISNSSKWVMQTYPIIKKNTADLFIYLLMVPANISSMADFTYLRSKFAVFICDFVTRIMAAQTDSYPVINIAPIQMMIYLLSQQGNTAHKSPGTYKIFKIKFPG